MSESLNGISNRALTLDDVEKIIDEREKVRKSLEKKVKEEAENKHGWKLRAIEWFADFGMAASFGAGIEHPGIDALEEQSMDPITNVFSRPMKQVLMIAGIFSVSKYIGNCVNHCKNVIEDRLKEANGIEVEGPKNSNLLKVLDWIDGFNPYANEQCCREKND